MPADVCLRIVNLIRVIDNRGHTYFPDELVPALSLAVLPVVNVQERIPSENEVGIRFLLDIGLNVSGIELLVVYHIDRVLRKTVLPILQNPRGTAGDCRQQDGRYEEQPFHRQVVPEPCNRTQTQTSYKFRPIRRKDKILQ